MTDEYSEKIEREKKATQQNIHIMFIYIQTHSVQQNVSSAPIMVSCYHDNLDKELNINSVTRSENEKQKYLEKHEINVILNYSNRFDFTM